MSEEFREIRFTLNGAPAAARVSVRKSLVDALRQDFGHTGSHVGCEHGACGACSVVLDGAVVRGCLVLATAVEGSSVETIEGASDSGRLARLQAAFYERAALQCGFCTPGMLLTAAELLERNPRPSRGEIRHYLSGNYCRCTGYEAIVDAVERAAGG